ncbi:methyltransferase type 11 [Pseudovibrio brasiliensis]|uniref:Methyltransferase type 11 n=1 Tax=Pseudovibrio brasiliensis TaxID=1898042 RepID=A0ABX8AWZ1_9HYPH|nr:methyltransferase type 11 [Pseudovibrio brasiliensis]QUS59083.1 methyltransferase type 11 [Pseudovibrio brasiliensis]
MKKSVYRRPDKPMMIDVKRPSEIEVRKPVLSAPVIVDSATECHVTPADVAARMVDYLGPVGDYLTLEPSAGTGALIKALLASGHSPCELVAIERHIKLATSLNFDGVSILNRCFLEYVQEVQGKAEFARIIMNPPFSKVRQHIKAALDLLGRHTHEEPAILVALVPITFKHDEAETLETLGPDTFSAAKVNTKIIRIER